MEERSDSNNTDVFSYFWLYLTSLHLARKANAVNKELKNMVEDFDRYIKALSKEDAIEHHSAIKAALDKDDWHILTFPKHWSINPMIDPLTKMVSYIKLLEEKYRQYAYPERNEILFSYDELRELNSITDLSF